jgi:selenide,water dikinase
MGGRPLVALNVAAFPEGKLPAEVLADILRGGVETAAGAGCAVIGGHTVNDAEPKYGLCVVGTVHPDKIVTNGGAQAGDALILTKPLGTGILSTVLKAGQLDAGGVGRLVEVMTTLNDKASARMLEFGATACTDVTGYGLAGHALEMARAAGLTVRIVSAEVPVLAGALEGAGKGHLTGGGNNNRTFADADASIDPAIGENLLHVIFDPQTAGGLLIAVASDRARALMDSLEKVCPGAAIVGECLEHDGVSLEIV